MPLALIVKGRSQSVLTCPKGPNNFPQEVAGALGCIVFALPSNGAPDTSNGAPDTHSVALCGQVNSGARN